MLRLPDLLGKRVNVIMDNKNVTLAKGFEKVNIFFFLQIISWYATILKITTVINSRVRGRVHWSKIVKNA